MARTHVMQRAPTPLYAMPAAEIAALVLAAGDCIEYRTLAMLPEEQPRVCCIREIRENGTLVLDDETWISRTRLTWLKLHKVEMARDTAEPAAGGPADGGNADDADDQTDQSDQTDLAPEPPTPAASAGAPPAGIPAARSAPPVDPNGTCRDCGKPFTRRSNVQKACPDCTHAKAIAAARAMRAKKAAAQGRTFAPRADEATITARRALVTQWNTLRSRLGAAAAAAQLDTPENRTACRAKAITRDILGWYATKSRSCGRLEVVPPVPAVCKTRPPAPGGRDATDANASASRSSAPAPAPASAPAACIGAPPAGIPALRSTLADRLIAFADRLGAAEDLVSRAERALAILEAYPEAGE